MKTFVPFRNASLRIAFLFTGLITAASCFSQMLPELVFKNPTLTSGTAGANGAKYRFSNVSTGIDAVVTIMGRTSASVILTSIDTTGTGYDKAWQPVIKYNGIAAANSSWSMDFRINFYKAGTNTKKQVSFYATTIDMDGDNSTLREWGTFKKIRSGSLAFASPTSITKTLLASTVDLVNLDNNGDDYKLTGTTVQYNGIDTAALKAMSHFSYDIKDQIDITYGASTGGTTATNPERLNSIWFKTISLGSGFSLLPVKLVDFTAKYDKKDVVLTWKSAEEIDFNYYQLEHSTDGNVFTTTSLVFAAAKNGQGADYTYVDNSVEGRGGLIYYRLKMVDIDGNFTYSAVRIVRLGEQINSLSLSAFPNPVVNDLRITLPSTWQNKQVKITLLNVSGQQVNELNIANSNQTESMSVASLQRGTYFVKASCGSETAAQQIIKN